MLRRPVQFCCSCLKFGFCLGCSWKRTKGGAGDRKELLFIIIEIAVMTLTLPLRAAENQPSHTNSPFQIKCWTTEDHLPQHEIFCLKQTRDGYLWIGTHFGLSRFDGLRFTSFDEMNTPEMINETIDALAEDSEGTLWIGTAGGLLSYRDHRFQ